MPGHSRVALCTLASDHVSQEVEELLTLQLLHATTNGLANHQIELRRGSAIRHKAPPLVSGRSVGGCLYLIGLNRTLYRL